MREFTPDEQRELLRLNDEPAPFPLITDLLEADLLDQWLEIRLLPCQPKEKE